MRGLATAVGLVVALALPAGAMANVTAQPLPGSYSSPVFVTAPTGDVHRVLVVEQRGTVKLLVDDAPQAQDFLDIADLVLAPGDLGAGSEQGLLSVAFPPDYPSSGLFYAFYTDIGGTIRIDEFRRAAGNPNRADGAYRRPLLSIPHPGAQNHNGGQLQFDSSGHLYVSTGDGGTGGANARDLASRLGKILRINDPRQAVPAVSIWSYGLRNPFRFSFDRATGDLVVGDVGQNTYEEIDYVPQAAGAGQGRDFGWNVCEGRSVYPVADPFVACPLGTSTLPVFVTTQAAGNCSVISGYVVRDASLQELVGRYAFSDFCLGALRQLSLATPDAVDRGGVGSPQIGFTNPQSFGEDACGRVYVASKGVAVARLVDGSTSCAAPLPLPPVSPGPGGAAAAKGPRITLGGSRRQRVLRKRYLSVRVRCSRPCSLRVTGRLALPGRDPKLKTRTRKRITRTTTIKIPIGKAGRRRIRRALRAKRKVRAALTIRARDDAKRLTVATRSIRIIG
jgi:hypothetical protein